MREQTKMFQSANEKSLVWWGLNIGANDVFNNVRYVTKEVRTGGRREKFNNDYCYLGSVVHMHVDSARVSNKH